MGKVLLKIDNHRLKTVVRTTTSITGQSILSSQHLFKKISYLKKDIIAFFTRTRFQISVENKITFSKQTQFVD